MSPTPLYTFALFTLFIDIVTSLSSQINKEHFQSNINVTAKSNIEENIFPLFVSDKELTVLGGNAQADSIHTHIVDHVYDRFNNISVKDSSVGQRRIIETNPKLRDFSDKWAQALKRENLFPIDYGGSHPFEIFHRHRRYLLNNKYLTTNTTNPNYRSPFLDGLYQSTRRLQQLPWEPGTVYKPIRLVVDTGFIDSQAAMTSFSPEIDFIKKIAIPYVTKFWSNALRVFPVVGGIRVQKGFCPVPSESYSTEGVPDSDLVIVLTANVESVCQSGVMAAARSCQADQWDRPTVGTAVLCLDKLDVNDEDKRKRFIRVILHEFAHVLGMRSIDFPYFYEPETGMYLPLIYSIHDFVN